MIDDPRVQAVLDLPLHRSLGLALADDGDPAAGLRLEVTSAVANPSGVLHGGLVPLVLDVTSFLCALPQLPDDTSAVTVSNTCSIIAAVRLGEVVHATARLERLGRTQAFFSAHLTVGVGGEQPRVVATGQVVKAVLALRS